MLSPLLLELQSDLGSTLFASGNFDALSRLVLFIRIMLLCYEELFSLVKSYC